MTSYVEYMDLINDSRRKILSGITDDEKRNLPFVKELTSKDYNFSLSVEQKNELNHYRLLTSFLYDVKMYILKKAKNLYEININVDYEKNLFTIQDFTIKIGSSDKPSIDLFILHTIIYNVARDKSGKPMVLPADYFEVEDNSIETSINNFIDNNLITYNIKIKTKNAIDYFKQIYNSFEEEYVVDLPIYSSNKDIEHISDNEKLREIQMIKKEYYDSIKTPINNNVKKSLIYDNLKKCK